MLRKCPKCSKYLTFHFEYCAGAACLIYDCDCGYSTRNEQYEYSDQTYIVKDNQLKVTNHT